MNTNNEHLCEDLRDLAEKIKTWDREDVCKMYEWMLQINQIARTLKDDTLFLSIISPDNLPKGSSPSPKTTKNVWTWDNHGRYIVGEHWDENHLKIRRLDELTVE